MDLEKLALSCKLEKEDLESNKENLNLVLEAFKILDKANTSDVEPLISFKDSSNNYREDEVKKNTSESKGYHFKIPFKL